MNDRFLVVAATANRRAEHLGGYDITDLGRVLWHG